MLNLIVDRKIKFHFTMKDELSYDILIKETDSNKSKFDNPHAKDGTMHKI